MKLPDRRKFLGLAATAAVLPARPRMARAQSYPTRPVRCIVGYAPGGGTDILVRLVGQSLPARLGQPFVIENRPGASSNLATEVVIRAPADGYTLLGTDSAAAINATLYEKLNFNFIRDIVLVGITRGPLVVAVHPSLPVRTIPELLAYAKANPRKIAMASAGNGSVNHMAGELFKAMAGVDMTHVPYRGAGPAVGDLIAGQVQIMFVGLPPSVEHVRSGTLRALAVTSAMRVDALPDIPPAGEFVSGYEASTWWAIGIRRSTPPEIIDKINRMIGETLAETQVKTRLAELGTTKVVGSPDEFDTFVTAETDKWAKAVKFSGAKA
ncbi:MAG: MFS transporter [Proteobacteria bacterium]|nr:MAG: MFS transporter [Pseudomonadota bacterium]